MALQPSIILAGRGVDAMGAIAQGTANGQNMLTAIKQRDQRQAVNQFGAAARQGDENALNQLSRFDPAMAQGLQVTNQNMETSRINADRSAQMFPLQMQGAQLGIDQTMQQMRYLDDTTAREVQAYAAGITAEERAAQAERTRQAVAAALSGNWARFKKIQHQHDRLLLSLGEVPKRYELTPQTDCGAMQ
ncbi:hypothetical protein OAN307_c12990 [Octadecabacter antarcticus 307]|uniref:Uncharacterized protein n=1 Tax=Octadecabacter antarcticus 307 TaxID=391626 RepID=M9R464_9RHOB|nr:hypothetical protein [Octadecabacter antarcticus]AGI66992.1 hypothetical protein OAN307_c12990 [Octadecabacter antarcticus 307]